MDVWRGRIVVGHHHPDQAELIGAVFELVEQRAVQVNLEAIAGRIDAQLVDILAALNQLRGLRGNQVSPGVLAIALTHRVLTFTRVEQHCIEVGIVADPEDQALHHAAA